MYVVEYQKRSTNIYSEFEGHCHTVYEIYYFIDGDAEIMVEGKIYPLLPHTLFLIPPNVLHGIQVNSRAEYARDVLYISPDDLIPDRRYFLTSLIPDLRKNPRQELIYEHTEAFHLDSFFYNLKCLDDQQPEVREILAPVFSEALLSQIYLLCRTLKPAAFINQMPEKMTEIINYVNAHLTEHLSLDAIASTFFISKNYLNKLFKQYLGTTVMDYVRYKRIILAKQHIQAGGSAMDAALQSGFSDYSSFYRSYVKFEGKSPRRNQAEAVPPEAVTFPPKAT